MTNKHLTMVPWQGERDTASWLDIMGMPSVYPTSEAQSDWLATVCVVITGAPGRLRGQVHLVDVVKFLVWRRRAGRPNGMATRCVLLPFSGNHGCSCSLRCFLSNGNKYPFCKAAGMSSSRVLHVLCNRWNNIYMLGVVRVWCGCGSDVR